MKGDVAGKPPQPQPHDHHEPRGHYDPSAAAPIDDAILRNYLADHLPAEELARVEKALRDSAQLRARLEEVRNNREDIQLHTLGAIWHRSRLTCPSRQQLGSYLLDALDPDLASYFKFHLEVIACPFCQANLADLDAQSKAATAAQASRTRQHRILKSSQHLLGEDGRGA
jgi:hypothetical protein